MTASDGGEVDLAGAITGTTVLTLPDAASVLNVSAVTSLQDTTVNVGNGGAANFSALTNLTQVNLSATTGGQILLPAAKTYADGVTTSYSIQATGTGSRIDLSGLTGMAGSNSVFGAKLSVTASDGGEVDLAGAITGTTVLTLPDAASVLNVSAVTSLQDTTVNVGNGGAANFSALTNLTQVNLSATTGGQILLPAAKTYADGVTTSYSIQATGTGSRIDLSGLTGMAGSNSVFGAKLSVTASDGGEVDLAGAITGTTVLTLPDAASVLNVSAVTSLQDTTVNVGNGGAANFSALTNLTQVNLSATTGGQILLPAAKTYADGVTTSYSIQATGTGSRIDLSGLTGMAGSNSVFGAKLSVTASDGGEVDLAGAITGTTVLTLPDAASVLNVSAVTSLQDTTVNVGNGGAANFSALTNLTQVNLSATTGGQILLPAAKTYADGVTTSYSIQATGTGSRIDLSGLTGMAGSNSVFGAKLSVTASDGGEVDLAGAITGTTVLTLPDAASVLNVSAVTSLQDTTVNVGNGGAANFSALTNLTQVNLSATTGGQILLPAAKTYADGVTTSYSIQATGTGSRIDLSGLTGMAGSNSVFGAKLSVTASDGGEVDLAGAITGTTVITLDGPRGLMNIQAVSTISGTSLTAANGATWVFPAGWYPIWGSGNMLTTSGAGSQFVNLGTLSVAGVSLAINTSAFTNKGVLAPGSGGTLDFNGSFRIDDPGILASGAGGVITITGNLLGDTRNANLYAPLGTVRFDGSGTAIAPQQLEVMGRDLGSVAAGFTRNFVYGALTLANNTYLKLTDVSDNAAGTEPEALYTNSLIVPAGSTLDLNGLHLYTRVTQIAGTIVGGTVTQIPDSGPLTLATLTPGSISVAGELDEWTFFGRGGRRVTVAVNPGSGGLVPAVAPYLNYAQVQIVDAAGAVLATASGSTSGQILNLSSIALPADGTYRVQVRAAPGHTSATGDYMVSVWDATPETAPVVLNQQVTGLIENPFSVDQWTFSATANQQVRFDLVNTSMGGIAFDLTGPNAWTGFTGITGDSDLVTLPSSGTYTLTARWTGGQWGGTYAFRLVETQQTDLSLGTAYNGAFVGSGQAQVFRIDVPASNPLKIVLDDSATSNVNELYLKYGSPPTRGDYDYRFGTPAASDQQILVPMAYSGTWYALVYGDTIRVPDNYTLLATTADVSVQAVTTDHYATNADATLTITGAGFDASTSVELVSVGGTHYPASSVRVDSFTSLTAVFAANTVPPDLANGYSLVVSKTGATAATLVNAFHVKPAGQARWRRT